MQHAAQLLIDLLEGRLDDAVSRDVERHLVECPVCREDWQAIQAVKDTSGDPVTFRPVPEYFSSILPRVRSRLEERRRWSLIPDMSNSIVRVVLPATFAIIAIATLSHLQLMAPDGQAPEGRMNVAPQELADFVSTVDLLSTVELATAAGIDDRALLASGDVVPDPAGLEDVDPTNLHAMLDTFGNEEANELITRLGQRTTL